LPAFLLNLLRRWIIATPAITLLNHADDPACTLARRRFELEEKTGLD
jgi:hypothetical protein